jgi:hypothetical protein
MPRPYGLSQWHACVSTHLPHLSAPQRQVLALWSFGTVLAQRCGLTTVGVLLAALFQQRDQTLIQRLRDWYRTARHKSGAAQSGKRREVDVTTCFAPLLRWVLQLLPTDCRTLALAMDASTLGQRFTILNLRVVICGSAIPVAWKVVPATAKGAWRPHWEGLFAHLRAVTPADWTVIVLADRGVSARWLFRTITAMGWRPFLRINRQGQYRPAGATDDQPLTQVVSKVWSGLERTSHVFHNPRTPGGRHRAGALGPRLYRTQVDPDRLAAQPGRGHVVWHARLDRGGLQGRQTRRLALGTDQNDRPAARRTVVVDHGAGDVVGGERRLRCRGGAPGVTAGGIAGNPYRPPAREWSPGAARHQLLPPQAVGPVDGLAPWRFPPSDAVGPRTLDETS